DEDCTPCNPQGASGTNPPSVGPELKDMYVDLLASVKDIHFRKRWAEPLSARDGDFCCRQTLDCVNVQSLNIPMCYDKFTTNFAFSDGSYGSLTTGDYTQGDAKANLISGDYTKGSESGNIYAQDPSAKPNTATLSIPPQWTGTGVGSAIPATGLGSVIVITTTIPGTTVSGATTLPALTTLGTTIPARTVTAATTIAPMTAVVTTTVDGSETAAASSSSKGAATQLSTDSTRSFGMSIITALLYAI
ncbi:hypothetical protein BU26DRAFT_404981, partial [Trematosphaeria pertusa]